MRKIPYSEKNTSLSSNHISHFTPKFDTLIKILDNGFRPSFCSESPIYREEYFELKAIGEIVGMETPPIEKINIPMVCFCDIPLKLSNYHRSIYGSYGIALHKSWAISNWISPVNYIVKDTNNHSILFSIQNQFEKFKQEFEKSGNELSKFPNLYNLDRQLFSLWNFMKSYRDDDTNQKYYDEREWRYIPESFNQDNMNNPETFLKFNSSDIYQIIVRNAKERRMVNKILRSKYDRDFKKLIRIRN